MNTDDLTAGWRARLLASELITMATVTAAVKQARTNTGFRSAKSGVMMLMLSVLFASKTKAKPSKAKNAVGPGGSARLGSSPPARPRISCRIW